jgi:hypothetical protein
MVLLSAQGMDVLHSFDTDGFASLRSSFEELALTVWKIDEGTTGKRQART